MSQDQKILFGILPVCVGTGIFWFLWKPFPLKSERLVAGFSNGLRPIPSGSLGGGLKGGPAVHTGGSVGFCEELWGKEKQFKENTIISKFIKNNSDVWKKIYTEFCETYRSHKFFVQ